MHNPNIIQETIVKCEITTLLLMLITLQIIYFPLNTEKATKHPCCRQVFTQMTQLNQTLGMFFPSLSLGALTDTAKNEGVICGYHTPTRKWSWAHLLSFLFSVYWLNINPQCCIHDANAAEEKKNKSWLPNGFNKRRNWKFGLRLRL